MICLPVRLLCVTKALDLKALDYGAERIVWKDGRQAANWPTARFYVTDRNCLSLYDRPLFRPVPFRLDGEALEQVAAALEETLERGDCERLAEAPRAGDEELPAARIVGERFQYRSLVDVGVAISA